jgi:vancomycin resistance protein YoaR
MYQQGYRPPSPSASRTAKRPMGKVRIRPQAPPSQGKPAPQSVTMGYKPPVNGTMVRHKKHKSGIGRVLFLVLALGVLAFGAFYLKTWLEVRPYDSTFAPNVYVDNIPLGGMQAKDGVAAVRAGAKNKTDSLSIRLMAGDQVYAQIDSSMLGITYDTDTALNEAWSIGHKGTVFDRKRDIDLLYAQGFKAYSATPGANTQPVDALLTQLKNDLYREPQNASFSFEHDASEPFTFVPEVQGRKIEIETLKQQIYDKVNAMESGDIQIIPTFVQPEVTEAKLRETVTLRYRATTPVSPDSEDNRTNNIRHAFEEISGTVLEPGSKFSFNNVVGWRTEKNGFFPAPEYAYGELSTGIGGGVCQASTTVYLAAICAGLEIVHREPHSDPVSYTSFGKDATVYMSSNRKIDFVFKNNTEGKIYITAAVKTDPANRKRFYCEVSIYGLSLGDVSYELVTKEIETIPAPEEPEIIKDKQHQYVTYVGDEYRTMKARDGHVVASELVKKVNGVEVERTPVAEDTYKARAERIYVGTEEKN